MYNKYDIFHSKKNLSNVYYFITTLWELNKRPKESKYQEISGMLIFNPSPLNSSLHSFISKETQDI